MPGYLGKVSALVTVNTADIASKVQSGFAAPFDKALRSIESQLRNTNRSIEKSFADIYTPAQKTARAISAAMMGAVKSFDAEGFSKKLQVRDDIADPVKRLASEIEKTSGILRSSFEPRIVALQAESQALFDRMATDAASVASGEITALIRKVEALGGAFKSAAASADGWERLSAIGRGDKSVAGSATGAMFAGLGAASRKAVGDADTRAELALQRSALGNNLGAFSTVPFNTPLRRGVAGAGGRATTGIGSFTDISQQGMRTNLPQGYLAAGVAQRRSMQQEAIDEATARAADAAQRAMAANLAAQQRQAMNVANAAAVSRQNVGGEFRDSFGGRGAAGLNLGLDRNALAAASSELQIIQRAIGRASAEARGPAVAAFTRLRNAIADAFENGTLETEGTRRSLAALRQEAVNAAAQVGGVSRRSLTRDVQRAGDISRGGLDKLGLALQQAGFALDDFFSATGGLDMKIRAVSNNISQMAFILGGTAGLFTGLAFTIGSQVVVAMMKWADAGRSSADYNKAMNSSLDEQRRLVDELAKSYKDLAKSFSSAMSSSGRKSLERSAQFADILSARRRSAESAIYNSDSGVLAARASGALAQNDLSKANTVAKANAAQLRVAFAAQQEEMAKAAAMGSAKRYASFVGNGAAAGNSVQAGIQIAMQRLGELEAKSMTGERRAAFEQELQRKIAAVPAAPDIQSATAQLRKYAETELAGNPFLAGMSDFGPLSSTVEDLMNQLARLEFALNETNSQIIDGVNKSLAGTADAIEKTRKTIDGAAMQTQDVAALSQEIDRVAASLEALSIAASETTDKDVLTAIADDAKAAQSLAEELDKAAGKARDFADELAKSIADEKSAAERGADLGKVRDGMDRVNDIRAQASAISDDAKRREFVNQAFSNLTEDTAGIVKGFGQERTNALLGGPSRQALEATDVASSEGQRELNRLLRGDDASRDVNFAEMQKQTDLLAVIADGIKAATGIVVDFR